MRHGTEMLTNIAAPSWLVTMTEELEISVALNSVSIETHASDLQTNIISNNTLPVIALVLRYR